MFNPLSGSTALNFSKIKDFLNGTCNPTNKSLGAEKVKVLKTVDFKQEEKEEEEVQNLISKMIGTKKIIILFSKMVSLK